VRRLHRLGIYTQHTIRHLGSCPNIAVVGGSVHKAGRAGATAIDLGHILKKEDGQLALPNFWCSVGEVNELVSWLQQHLPPGAPLQPGDTGSSQTFEAVL
jgi:hypothetical protein